MLCYNILCYVMLYYNITYLYYISADALLDVAEDLLARGRAARPHPSIIMSNKCELDVQNIHTINTHKPSGDALQFCVYDMKSDFWGWGSLCVAPLLVSIIIVNQYKQ